MNQDEKKEYLEGYKKAKENGEFFFPDSLFKDAIVSLSVFLVLVALAFFIGAPLEARANPADASYTPRPEWYFLFLFQLLKYFPGNIEVLGVVVLPTIAIIALFLLPIIDRHKKRYAFSRPVIVGFTGFMAIGAIFLTIQAYREAPPPAEVAQGDTVAVLYAKNCSSCHGPTISVTPGANLHLIISQGRHEGMPAWGSDLSTDQIDALAGFITSPDGNTLFNQYCGTCHHATDLVSLNALELKNALDLGSEFPAHQSLDIPDWNKALGAENSAKLLNFLIAPDGERLFTINCYSCHGDQIAFEGDENQLRNVIIKGGVHLQMPPWKGKISEADIELLARYVVDPASTPQGNDVFKQVCATCHGERIPQAENVDQARKIIAEGGAHQTMPIWGQILTEEQITALTKYIITSANGGSISEGSTLFNTNCSPCHGELGEGGINPTRPNDIIAPISSAEYLKTRDNFTLRAIISEGQPNFGMSPFSTSLGGPLSDDEIDAIVAYLRSWESNPPVEIPPEIQTGQAAASAEEIFTQFCSKCHGLKGYGGVGPALSDPVFQDKSTDQQIYDSINLGHNVTAMIGWGDILTADQIQQLVTYIRKLRSAVPIVTQSTPQSGQTGTATPETLSFTADILPIFKTSCNMCHGSSGGWNGTDYADAMNTGDHKPVIIPGDSENSLLAQKILGTQTFGTFMPPTSSLSSEEIQLILNWIKAGALE